MIEVVMMTISNRFDHFESKDPLIFYIILIEKLGSTGIYTIPAGRNLTELGSTPAGSQQRPYLKINLG